MFRVYQRADIPNTIPRWATTVLLLITLCAAWEFVNHRKSSIVQGREGWHRANESPNSASFTALSLAKYSRSFWLFLCVRLHCQKWYILENGHLLSNCRESRLSGPVSRKVSPWKYTQRQSSGSYWDDLQKCHQGRRVKWLWAGLLFPGNEWKKTLKFALNTWFEKWQLEFSCFSALILTGSNSNS